MREVGRLDPRGLEVRETFRTVIDPLTPEVYHDLLESIKRVGVLISLILCRIGDTYVVLSGHHRRIAAIEAGLATVPCSLAETYEEMEGALYDNVYRRQMTDEQRKAAMSRREELIDSIIRETTAPEIYELHVKGKLNRKILSDIAGFSPKVQKTLLDSLATERLTPPEAILKRQEEKLKAEFTATLKTKEQEAALQARLITQEKDGLAKELAALKEESATQEAELTELKKVKSEILTLKKKYTVERETIELEVKKQFEVSTKEEQVIQARQNKAIKDKDREITELNGRIDTLNNTIKGKEAMIGVFQQKVGKIYEDYIRNVQLFANPNTIVDPMDLCYVFLGRTHQIATVMQLLPKGVAQVKELGEVMSGLIAKIVTACETNVLILQTPDEQIKAIEKEAPDELPPDTKQQPALRVARAGDLI